MFISFIEHSIKDTIRNARFDLRLFLKVLSGISIFYFLIVLFYLGYDFKSVIQLFHSSSDPVTIINYRLLHLCAALLILQIVTLQNPLKALLAYLHLPVKSKRSA